MKKKFFHDFFFDSKMSINLNEWINSNNIFFMTIIDFYFIQNWIYRKKLLNFEILHDSHTNDNFVVVVNKIFEQYQIENRLFAIITNNVNNNETMIEIIQNCLNNLRCIVHLFCLTHVIQLTIQKFLKILMFSSNNENEKTIWKNKINMREMFKKHEFALTMFKMCFFFILQFCLQF